MNILVVDGGGCAVDAAPPEFEDESSQDMASTRLLGGRKDAAATAVLGGEVGRLAAAAALETSIGNFGSIGPTASTCPWYRQPLDLVIGQKSKTP